MASKWYGSINNRIEENHMFCDEIKVGTGVTEYHWSDREAYEVIAVRDQKHVTVRRYDVKHVGEAFSNDWKLISNPDNPERTLERRGDIWYWTNTITADDIKDIEDNIDLKVRLVMAGYDIDKIRKNGKQTRRYRANVSFGVANYHYDYSF